QMSAYEIDTWLEFRRVLFRARGGEYDRVERPSDTQQEAVRPGHIRRREVGVLGLRAGAEGEVEVDGVFGQHRDQRQEGDGQCPEIGRASCRERERCGEGEGSV